MAAALPLSCLLVLFLCLRRFQLLDWRSSLLLAALLWGLLLTAITEVLSFLCWLEFWPVVAAWALALLVLVGILTSGSARPPPSGEVSHSRIASTFEISLLAYLFFVVVATGAIAWVAPPNTWDSMTYHLSRVMHWMQNKSVAFYPTHILRQLHLNPWSEYAILHFWILTGNDRLANFIQWFSMIGCLVGVSLLARELGAGVRGQIFSVVFCSTLPMGILQSTSTQTDYATSLWVTCLVYFAILLRKSANLIHALATGAALGLAVLTKATAYIFTVPFLVWLGLSAVVQRDARRRITLFAFALVVSLLANLGHYARSLDLYGNPLGPGKEGPGLAYSNDTYSLAGTASNLARNAGLHLGTPFGRANDTLEHGILLLHRVIGIPLNDPRTTWPYTEFHVPAMSFNEDIAGNPVHVLLILAAVFVYAFQPKNRESTSYILALGCASLIFCLVLKWQPWHSRLHLPLFVLSAPFVGLTFGRVRHERCVNALIFVVAVAAVPWLLFSATKPVMGKNSVFCTKRTDQYFRSNLPLAQPYKETAQVLAALRCFDIGLDIGSNDWEYPLWVLLREETHGPMHLEHVEVENISNRKADRSAWIPCAVVSTRLAQPETISIFNTTYSKEWSADPIRVYTRAYRPSATGLDRSDPNGFTN